jgi:hypothetical protein
MMASVMFLQNFLISLAMGGPKESYILFVKFFCKLIVAKSGELKVR